MLSDVVQYSFVYLYLPSIVFLEMLIPQIFNRQFLIDYLCKTGVIYPMVTKSVID